MVRCWFMDDGDSDQRLEHHRTPEQFCTIDELFRRTGVEYFHVLEIAQLTCCQLEHYILYRFFITVFCGYIPKGW